MSTGNSNSPEVKGAELWGLDVLFGDHYLGHSIFQQDYFITTKANGPTAYGQYKQALRELYKRTKAMVDARHNAKIRRINIEELEANIEQGEAGLMKENPTIFDVRRWKAELEHSRRNDEAEHRQMYELAREWLRFYQQASYLKDVIGEITPKRRAELEQEMWSAKIIESVVTDLRATNSIRQGTQEMIMALPLELRNEIYRAIKDKSIFEKIQNLDRQFSKLPPAEDVEFDEAEVQKVINHGEKFFQLS